MEKKRVLVILGHPATNGFSAAIARAYAQSARQAGHDVREIALGELAFDPSLHQGYQQIQPLEPDLVKAREDILWAQHLVFAYPIWWGSVPAVLKGFLDRCFLPGFAFKYREGKHFPDKLLAGRTGQLLVTMDTPPWWFRWVWHAPGIHQMKTTTLAFCGVRPVKVMTCGPILGSTDEKRARWLQQARDLATRI